MRSGRVTNASGRGRSIGSLVKAGVLVSKVGGQGFWYVSRAASNVGSSTYGGPIGSYA